MVRGCARRRKYVIRGHFSAFIQACKCVFLLFDFSPLGLHTFYSSLYTLEDSFNHPTNGLGMRDLQKICHRRSCIAQPFFSVHPGMFLSTQSFIMSQDTVLQLNVHWTSSSGARLSVKHIQAGHFLFLDVFSH